MLLKLDPASSHTVDFYGLGAKGERFAFSGKLRIPVHRLLAMLTALSAHAHVFGGEMIWSGFELTTFVWHVFMVNSL